ncbi:MAG: YqgE/AlgH family protein [Pseudomonadota bacterium]
MSIENASDNTRPSGPQDFLTGQILIAMPNMGDSRFEKSVVYICAHDEQHAMGLVVNKPLAEIDMMKLLQQLDIDPLTATSEAPVFFGGPVQTERGAVLHTLDYRIEATLPLNDEIGITASRDVLIDIGGKEPKRAAPRRYLLLIGHAGWGAGQLEQELAMNAWAHCEPDESIIFDGAKNPSWQNALAKLGVTEAMFSPEWAEGRNAETPLN